MKRTISAIWVASVALGALSVSETPSKAESLSQLIPQLLATHDRVQAGKSDLDASRERIRETRGRWFPELNVSGHYGYENINKTPGTPDTSQPSRVLDASITQLLWDGGAANAAEEIYNPHFD